MRPVQLLNKVVNKIDLACASSRARSYPVSVDVVIIKNCNLACVFCKDYTTEGLQRIKLADFEKMAKQILPTAARLNICSGGEPYLHTELEQMLRIAKGYNVYTWVLSNGMLLDRQRMEPILREGLIDEHGFSVDGIKPETVEGIRVNARLSKIIDNIAMVVDLKKSLGVTQPKLVIRYALMRSNIEELPEAIEFWSSRGIDRMDCGYLSLANNMDPQLSLYFHQDLFLRVRDEALKVMAKHPHLTVNLPEPIADQKVLMEHPKKCTAPWNFVMIDTNGEVMPCYRAFEAMRFPSLYSTDIPFSEIWNSDGYRRLRATVNAPESTKYYNYCNICENRHGWSEERTHLGDTVWKAMVGMDNVNHQRPIRGTANRNAAQKNKP